MTSGTLTRFFQPGGEEYNSFLQYFQLYYFSLKTSGNGIRYLNKLLKAGRSLICTTWYLKHKLPLRALTLEI
jgi:hypothetical protein